MRRTYEDAGLPELIDRSVAGDPEAVSELWWRVSERVLSRLRASIGVFAAERATSQVLGRVLDELPAYDARAPAAERLARHGRRPLLRRAPARGLS